MTRPHASAVDREALSEAVGEAHRRICLLRYKNIPGKTREECLTHLGNYIEALKDRCDLPGGWTDPLDPFAEQALTIVRWEFAELTRPGREYPVPEEDPRPRTGSGHLVQKELRVLWTNTIADKEELKQTKFKAGNKGSKVEIV